MIDVEDDDVWDEVDDVEDGDVCEEVEDVEDGNVCHEIEDVENGDAKGQQLPISTFFGVKCPYGTAEKQISFIFKRCS